MKRILMFLAVGVFLFSAVGCGPEIQKTAGGKDNTLTGHYEAPKTDGNAVSGSSETSAVSSAPIESAQSVVTDESASKKEDLGSNDKTEAVSDSAQSSASASNSTTGATTQGQISKEEAKNIALWNASVTGSEIRDYEIELDRDGGVLHYEISFKFQNMEFEYEINAADGTIIKAEREFDD